MDAEGGQAGGFLSAEASEASPANGLGAAAGEGVGQGEGGGVGGGGEGGDGRGEEGLEGPEDAVFPRELGRLPRQLFHLRRGPLLGPLLQNSDDPLCLRYLFLRGALEECLRMMEPSMVSLKVWLVGAGMAW